MIDEPVLEMPQNDNLDQKDFIREILKDYWTCCMSREVSLLGRKDVLTGKGKFGILGDGKEVPQVAMARAFKKGDHRAGYYRDQTFMFALGLSSVEDFFAQLYADAANDPFSGGRQMNAHFATPYIDKQGNWTNHKDQLNISSGISSTGGQMARGFGLALASKKYRESEALNNSTNFSNNGNEVSFCTIGDASTSEGIFWETINAASVMKVPMAVSVWDDGYGISVPKKYQTTKGDISTILEGFRVNEEGEGLDIYKVKGWDYPALCEMYEKGIARIRDTHRPAVFHVDELTQPQGHSTSGSHERYKSSDRLEWEQEHDCIKKMREWILESGIATLEEVEKIEQQAKDHAKEGRDNAWNSYMSNCRTHIDSLLKALSELSTACSNKVAIEKVIDEVNRLKEPLLHEIIKIARTLQFKLLKESTENRQALTDWLEHIYALGHQRYHTHLYCENSNAAINIPITAPVYSDNSKKTTGYKVLNTYFDKVLERDERFFAFGEDVGQIGDVNQGFANMQKKYGIERVFDTGIREWSILGQALGMSMRGLRPVAEIQYLDYLVYALPVLTDDIATLRYRSDNLQQAPLIIRTRGHRLEGIWHSGSQMGLLLSSLRGMCILVPRNMVQAVGFYNTMLQSNDPALIVEVLNGYRLKETMPDNIGEYTVPVGVPEILVEGEHVTVVTYGACVRVAQEGVEMLREVGISVELIDVQSLLPFDLEHQIVESIKKTNRVLFLDEDVPGGASAYMMKEVLENQGAYQYLDSAPQTLTAKAHRPPYGSDGDYFSKPNAEDVFETVYNMMSEVDPSQFPAI